MSIRKQIVYYTPFNYSRLTLLFHREAALGCYRRQLYDETEKGHFKVFSIIEEKAQPQNRMPRKASSMPSVNVRKKRKRSFVQGNNLILNMLQLCSKHGMGHYNVDSTFG